MANWQKLKWQNHRNMDLISGNHRTKHTLVLTITRSSYQLFTKDLTWQTYGIIIQCTFPLKRRQHYFITLIKAIAITASHQYVKTIVSHDCVNQDHVSCQWVNNTALGDLCDTMMGRSDMEEIKSNVAMNAWLPQARYSCFIQWRIKNQHCYERLAATSQFCHQRIKKQCR